MKAKFIIRNYSFDIIPEISYSDYMDGTPDTMSFSFLTSEDLSEEILVKEKCEVQLWNVADIEVGNKTGSSMIINNVEYTIDLQEKSNDLYSSYYEFFDDNELLQGIILPNDKKIIFGDNKEYFYKGNFNDEVLKIYKDNKLHYYMCVSNISSEKMSTNSDENGYMTTVKLKEQTILLRDCVRTDIAITPSLYPQIEDILEDGETTEYKNLFDTLYQATLKIVDCHNMCSLNEPIKEVDDDLTNALKQVACPNLTYRDLSTYSQLYDVFMRVGRIPYFSNGTLYGIKVQGNKDLEIKNLDVYSGLSSTKEEGINDNIYSTKIYNNIYDNEVAVVPQIFTDMVKYIYFTPKTVKYKSGNDIISIDINSNNTFSYNGRVYHISNDYLGNPINVYYENQIGARTYYSVLSSNLTFIIDNVTLQIDGIYDSRNTSPMKISSSLDSPVMSRKNIYYADESGNGTFSIDKTAITDFINVEFRKWTLLNSQSENDVSKTLLFVRGFDTQGQSIADARAYSLSLPYNIEKIEHIYSCKPYIEVKSGTSINSYTIPIYLSEFPEDDWGYAKYINGVITELVLYYSIEPGYPKRFYAINASDDNNPDLYYLDDIDGVRRGTIDGNTIEFNFSQYVYYIRDISHKTNLKYSDVAFSWKLRRYDDDSIIEESIYNYLSELQKRSCCYYKRGSKTINNVVCLNVPDDETKSAQILQVTIGTGTTDDLEGAYAWSNYNVYEELKSQFYVVEYKPMLDTYYTNYDYHAGENLKPRAISNFNFPYSEVSDRQAYPILEYNLEKGLDTSRDIKIVTTDISILDIHAGDIVSYNNINYLVNTMSLYINNKTIECSFCLTDNIVQNSILSYYTDNVRVSSILSAESSVNRPIHLFGENVLKFYDRNNLQNTERQFSPSYFIEEVGSCLSSSALENLGLYEWSIRNVYADVSKYPFRFDQIIKPQNIGTVSQDTKYVIKLSTGSPEDLSRKIEIRQSDFPITICSACSPIFAITAIHNVREKVVRDVNELEAELTNRGYYMRCSLAGLEVAAIYLGIKKSGESNYTYLYPSTQYSAAYWPKLNKEYAWITGIVQVSDATFEKWSKDYVGNYRFYDVATEYDTTLYGTEKLITTSGLITKIEYAFPDSSYATSEFVNSSIKYPDNFISSLDDYETYSENFNTSDYKQHEDISGVTVTTATPVYYNRTDSGCKLAGIGNKSTDFYSLYKLNHLSPYGYYLDMRENPRPYVQFKTLARGDESIIIKQLSSETKFMLCDVTDELYPSFGQYMILKVPRFENISNVVINQDYVDENKICDVYVSQLMSEQDMCVLETSEYLVHSDEYDYLLCIYSPQEETSIKIVKFNITKGKSVNEICIDNIIYSEI